VISLSIIIVNYNSGELVVDCLTSLWRHNAGLSFEVIVVDNHSGDNSREIVHKSFSQVLWIQMDYNAGFARANNAGMKAAKGEVVLLLNPDTISLDNSISRCYHELIKKEFVAAGVQVLDSNKEPQIPGSYFIKGGLNHLLPIPYWGGFLRWIGYSSGSKVPHVKKAKAIEEVDWISGAFLMVKKEAIEKAGMMDEDFFLYAEEIEWCSRLKKTGRLCIFGDMQIIHLEGATINKSLGTEDRGYYNLYDKKGLQLMVSNHLRVRKQFGVGWFFFLLLNYTWGIFFFWLCSTLYNLFTLKNPAREWKKVAQMGGNVMRIWGLMPTIVRNKPHFYKMM
jgi:GT2 family glycosyltransferase